MRSIQIERNANVHASTLEMRALRLCTFYSLEKRRLAWNTWLSIYDLADIKAYLLEDPESLRLSGWMPSSR